VTGFCEDCGNTLCICPVPDGLPSPEPLASREYVMVPRDEYDRLAAANAWSARWKAVATRYRAMLARHRDRDALVPRAGGAGEAGEP
jgi:hypothetical protein